MAGDDRKSEAGRAAPSEAELAARLRALDKTLDKRADEKAAADRGKPGNTGYASALGLSSTFVSAILVGAGLGWAIDRFFDVAPWAMIFFMGLGFCAGTLNVMRSAKVLSTNSASQENGGTDRERAED